MKKLFYVGALSALLLAGCGEDTKQEEGKATVVENSTGASSEQTLPNTSETVQNTPETSTKQDTLNTTVSLKDAVAVFQSKHPEAQIHSVELDSKFGSLQYDITGLDSSYEYEMRIDANSKEILEDRSEAEREIESFLDFTTIVDPADAIQNASTNSQVTGLSPTSWKLETENGTPNYSIKYEKDFSEVEVYINASTGELMGVELDD